MIVENTHKNTTEQIRFLLDNGFNYVFPTKESVPEVFRKHPNAKTITDNLNGISQGVIWSDLLLNKTLDLYYKELSEIDEKMNARARDMIQVTQEHIERLEQVIGVLQDVRDDIQTDVKNLGFLGCIIHWRKFNRLEEKYIRILNQLKMNGQFVSQLRSTITELEYISKTD